MLIPSQSMEEVSLSRIEYPCFPGTSWPACYHTTSVRCENNSVFFLKLTANPWLLIHDFCCSLQLGGRRGSSSP